MDIQKIISIFIMLMIVSLTPVSAYEFSAVFPAEKSSKEGSNAFDLSKINLFPKSQEKVAVHPVKQSIAKKQSMVKKASVRVKYFKKVVNTSLASVKTGNNTNQSTTVNQTGKSCNNKTAGTGTGNVTNDNGTVNSTEVKNLTGNGTVNSSEVSNVTGNGTLNGTDDPNFKNANSTADELKNKTNLNLTVSRPVFEYVTFEDILVPGKLHVGDWLKCFINGQTHYVMFLGFEGVRIKYMDGSNIEQIALPMFKDYFAGLLISNLKLGDLMQCSIDNQTRYVTFLGFNGDDIKYAFNGSVEDLPFDVFKGYFTGFTITGNNSENMSGYEKELEMNNQLESSSDLTPGFIAAIVCWALGLASLVALVGVVVAAFIIAQSGTILAIILVHSAPLFVIILLVIAGIMAFGALICLIIDSVIQIVKLK